MNRGTIAIRSSHGAAFSAWLVAAALVVASCATPPLTSDEESPATTVASELQPIETTSAAQVESDSDVTELIAEQGSSPAVVSPPPEPGPRPGRGSRVRPEWLGTRVLPLRPDGFGQVVPTPFELIDRRFPPATYLRRGGADFESSIGVIPADVLARSTWREGCPVTLDELSYLTLSYIGFDDQPYVGEMIVHSSVANDIVDVFRKLFSARFPIEEMRVIAANELDLPPTGDGNLTSSFICRAVTGGTNWSEHAYGLALDINPFHNPYVKGELVLPELASVYADRSLGLPGVIVEGDLVVEAFDAIGWGWGGRWRTLTDPMHFAKNNR